MKKTYIIGIGSSAGGLEALQQFIQHLPNNLENATFIVAQHLSPQHKSMLVELLGKHANFEVRVAENNLKPLPRQIYITPPNADITIRNNCIRLTDPSQAIGSKPSVNRFFLSLAEHVGAHAIGVILSGTGTDGADGIRAIRAAGGITIAQKPNTAKYDGMPQSAIDTDCVDTILPPAEIGQYIDRVIRSGHQDVVTSNDFQADLDVVLQEVRSKTGMSFFGYKSSTLQRRLERRIVANGISKLPDYIDFLKESPEEPERLAQDFLISVTHFFRDPNAFDALASTIKTLIENKPDDQMLRIWSVGCATGEETYSLAILCAEALGGLDKLHKYNVQIFGTDIDTNALSVARRGVYPATSLSNIDAQIIEKYFNSHENYCEVNKRLKDVILFSKHNVLEDPPFSRIDLVVCRNLLIYFTEELQEKAFKLFHYAAKSHGYLFLGKSESVGSSEVFFKRVNAKYNIFCKRRDAFNQSQHITPVHARTKDLKHQKKAKKLEDYSTHPFAVSLINSIAPDALLINKNMDILHIYGNASKYLQLSAGKPSTNLNDVVAPSLRQELRAYVFKASRENLVIKTSSKALNIDGEQLSVHVNIYPVSLKDEEVMLLSFESKPMQKEDIAKEELSSADAERMYELEQELKATQEHLQTVIEELETSNEELQLLNEELQSSNEELQSSNEELETSNEELQSTNEELTTVNDELNLKKTEYQTQSDELLNIKNSLSFPLLRLDNNLDVVRFNDSAQSLFDLPVRPQFAYMRYMPEQSQPAEIMALAKKTVSSQREHDTKLEFNERHYWVRCVPYRKQNGSTSGVILLFIDDTQRVLSEARLRDSRERYNALASASDMPISIKDKDGRYIAVNTALQELIGKTEEQILGKTDYDLFDEERATNMSANDKQVQEEAQSLTFEERFTTAKKGVERTYLSVKAPLIDEDDAVYATSCISIDISERRQYLEKLMLYESVIENANDVVIITDENLKGEGSPEILYVNQAFVELTGFSKEESIGNTPKMLQGDKTDRNTLDALSKALKQGNEFNCELINYSKEGNEYVIEIDIFPVKNVDGSTQFFAAIQRDVTQRVEYEKQLEATNMKMQKASQAKSDFLANMSHEIRTPMNAICGIADLLHNFTVAPEKEKDFIHKLNASASQLKELINDILDFSKLEANQIEIHRQPFDVREMLQSVEDIHTTRAQERGIALHVPTSPHISQYLLGDKVRIKQILLNLLSNAIKFTDQGSVTLEVKAHEKDPNIINFIVTDTGVGIPKAQQAKIFQKFSQGTVGLDKKTGGTGLGLSITRSLAQAMGGSITLESEEGKGSCFAVSLPLIQLNDDGSAETKLSGYTDALPLKLPHPVLVVEDTQTNIDVITTYLEQSDIAYDEAMSGSEALIKMKNNAYSAVLLDLQMHELDGFTVMRKIKQLSVKNATDISVIAVTAHAEASIRERCFEAGMQDFITKPIEYSRLMASLSKVASKKPSKAS